MSSSWNMKQGPNFAPAYLVSGTPYVTGSGTGTENLSSTTKQFDFPYVSKFLTFSNITTNEELYVAFTEEGLVGAGGGVGDRHFFTVPGNGTTVTLDVRCKTVFLRSSGAVQWSLCAGLTGIESFPVLTGSNGFKGVG